MGTRTPSMTLTRVFALVVAFMLAIVALPAMAADGTANIKENAQSKIIVHKLSEPSAAAAAGTSHEVAAPAGSRPLKDVEFSVQKITGINLLEQEGWTKLAALKTAFEATPTADTITGQGLTLEPATTQRTQADGSATFNVGAIGVYLVTEGADHGNNGITSVAKPFLVTVPFPSKDAASGWNYEVHVYPKNTASLVEKTFDGNGATKVGDVVKWYVSFTIPGQQNITSFKFTDKIDTDTHYVGVSAKILPADTDKANFGTAFASGTAVNVVAKTTGLESDGSPSAPGQMGTVEATIADGAMLMNHRNKKLVVELQVKIADKVTGGGIVNSGGPNASDQWASGVFYNGNENVDPGDPNGPKPVVPGGDGAPTPAPWSTVDILAQTPGGGGDNTVPVEGAKYKIFKDKDAAKACATSGDRCDEAVVVGKDGRTEIVTDKNGNGTFTLPNGDYYIVQVETPPGFKKLPDPIKFELNGPETLTPYTNYEGSDKGTPVDIINDKWKINVDKQTPGGTAGDILPSLPMTGASGQVLLALAGSAVLLTAMGTFLVAMRRKKRH